MKIIVTGGQGFIGSHLVDALIDRGDEVVVIDNGSSGKNRRTGARYVEDDIKTIRGWEKEFEGAETVFHLAAIARTPWCIDDPILCYQTNVMGVINVLETARHYKIKRSVLASSNVVYAFMTPYRTSKEAGEALGKVYDEMYRQSVVSLRFSNVYGPRQSEEGPSPNVFAALRKSKKENGYLTITGDGEQTRDYTHVSDIVRGLILASESEYRGVVDLCTGTNTSLNVVAKYFGCPIKYIPDRPGDVKHIVQDPKPAKDILGWSATVRLEDGIKDVL